MHLGLGAMHAHTQSPALELFLEFSTRRGIVREASVPHDNCSAEGSVRQIGELTGVFRDLDRG